MKCFALKWGVIIFYLYMSDFLSSIIIITPINYNNKIIVRTVRILFTVFVTLSGRQDPLHHCRQARGGSQVCSRDQRWRGWGRWGRQCWASSRLEIFPWNNRSQYQELSSPAVYLREAFKKKNYVDRETVPKVGRGVAPFPYKNHSWDREYSSIDRGV